MWEAHGLDWGWNDSACAISASYKCEAKDHELSVTLYATDTDDRAQLFRILEVRAVPDEVRDKKTGAIVELTDEQKQQFNDIFNRYWDYDETGHLSGGSDEVEDGEEEPEELPDDMFEN